MSQELNQALTEAAQDPQTAGYCQEIVEILAARERGELSREEAEYLLREMAEVRVAQNTAATEQGVRWTIQAISLAAKLI
jgi:hypothetical protein